MRSRCPRNARPSPPGVCRFRSGALGGDVQREHHGVHRFVDRNMHAAVGVLAGAVQHFIFMGAHVGHFSQGCTWSCGAGANTRPGASGLGSCAHGMGLCKYFLEADRHGETIISVPTIMPATRSPCWRASTPSYLVPPWPCAVGSVCFGGPECRRAFPRSCSAQADSSGRGAIARIAQRQQRTAA